MANGKFIGYIRVSTDKQGKSGLGLEAQKKAIVDYLNGGNWDLIAEYVEVESGKNDCRIELQKALQHCKMTGASLVIAKLDRLSRDLHFISSLMKSGIEFTACDMPTANKFTVHIYAALAEQEREMISARTKAALQAARERGVVLGKPDNLTNEAKEKGRKLGTKATIAKADMFAGKVADIIQELQGQGMSLRGIAKVLNERGILTARGKSGSWTATAVRNILNRERGK
ncbi:recombinase family protein [Syntrophus buswellii]|uniref:recombinase family protein n=1 Tax=Syntrophus buswellii TaxID=43774 RepID=UPI0038D3F965